MDGKCAANNWLLKKMMADGLNNIEAVYEPIINVIYSIQ
jgi:hypothetical protein